MKPVAKKLANKGDVAKADTAKRKAAKIDAGQKGRTTRTDKTEADMYDRQIGVAKKTDPRFASILAYVVKEGKGLKNASAAGPQKTAKISSKNQLSPAKSKQIQVSRLLNDYAKKVLKK